MLWQVRVRLDGRRLPTEEFAESLKAKACSNRDCGCRLLVVSIVVSHVGLHGLQDFCRRGLLGFRGNLKIWREAGLRIFSPDFWTPGGRLVLI